VALVVLLALVLSGCGTDGGSAGDDPADGGDGGAASAPQPLPELSLDAFDSDSEPLALGNVRGPAVISLWASWCAPCREEMPVLEQFHQQYAGRVDLIGIDFQDPQTEKAADLVAETGVTYPLYSDFRGELNGLDPFPNLRGLPFLALVDDRGRVVHQEFVVVDSVAELEEMVSEHLGVGA
jgi:cytochrome c biogenesis protein CcmG/thiol:disulfide interchange protein DsbE